MKFWKYVPIVIHMCVVFIKSSNCNCEKRNGFYAISYGHDPTVHFLGYVLCPLFVSAALFGFDVVCWFFCSYN